jgi:hypothetical protein
MKKLILAAAAALSLAACQLPPTAANTASAPSASSASAASALPQMTPADACQAWAATLKAAAAIHMSAAGEHQAGILELSINPLCTGTQPTSPAELQTAIQKALVTMAAIEAVDYAAKQSAPAKAASAAK